MIDPDHPVIWQRTLKDTPITKCCVRFHNRLVEKLAKGTVSALLDIILRVVMLAAAVLVYPALAILTLAGRPVVIQASHSEVPAPSKEKILEGVDQCLSLWEKKQKPTDPMLHRLYFKCGSKTVLHDIKSVEFRTLRQKIEQIEFSTSKWELQQLIVFRHDENKVTWKLYRIHATNEKAKERISESFPQSKEEALETINTTANNNIIETL